MSDSVVNSPCIETQLRWTCDVPHRTTDERKACCEANAPRNAVRSHGRTQVHTDTVAPKYNQDKQLMMHVLMYMCEYSMS